MTDQDLEYTLTFAKQTAVVSPFGASVRRYSVDLDGSKWNILWGYRGGAGKRGGQGDVLIPFPGRTKEGMYEWRGQRHELVKNDKDGPNAIHGFLRAQLFSIERVTSTEAVFVHEIGAGKNTIQGYPFSLRVKISYSLGSEGLTTQFQITNTGSSPAPAGAGFHPYFLIEETELANWEVMIPAQKYIELENFVPTGRTLPVEGTPLDLRRGRRVGDTRYNDCVMQLARDSKKWSTAWITSKDSKRRILIRMDENFDYVVIYTGDQIAAPDSRKAIAIEPMTCGPDAFNHHSWGLRSLEPNESMVGSYVISGE